MKQHDWNSLTDAERQALLTRPALADDAALKARVAEIVAEVRRDGDAALRRLTRTIDGIEIDAVEVSKDEIDAAERALSPAQRNAIRAAAANIEAFHRAQLPADLEVETAPGVRCERISRPIRRVGLYVPAGTAPLPSTALMLGIPARLA
ncbi:MAG: histidinol dehydrogenase, partial [Gammaproteobacteria bacterium]